MRPLCFCVSYNRCMRPIALGLILFILFMVVAHVYSIGKEVSNEIGVYPDGRKVSVETYVRQHITELSPVKEVLGGKFYVTEIHASGGRGLVAYEDGHNAYLAEFTYSIRSDVGIIIESFYIK